MKASELIEKLQNMIAKNGDVDVVIQDIDNSLVGWADYVDYNVSSDGDDIIVIQSHRMYSDDMILSYEDEDEDESIWGETYMAKIKEFKGTKA